MVDPLAEKDLKNLWKSDRRFASKIISLIEILKFDPFQGKPLKGAKKGVNSLRLGDYRILYEIHFHQKKIHIIRIGHRREIYR